MKPIKLAVIFDQQIHAGGGYQQALNAAKLAKAINSNIAEPIFFTSLKENVPILAKYDIEATYLAITLYDKLIMLVRRNIWNFHFINFIKKIWPYNKFELILNKSSIDLVYFLTPDGRYRDLERLNYIATIWDLCHRDDPEFPEVRWDRRAEVRDKNYQQFLPKATAILVDSDFSKRNIAHRYGVDIDRIHVMPFEAAVETQFSSTTLFNLNKNSIDIEKKYNLTFPYIFYPAQFWPHKNHIYLLQALSDLRSRYGISVGAIFVGSDKGNLAYIKKNVISLGLSDIVRFGGFVPNEEISILYKRSLALVMPTYFGPTNLPPLEAFELGVPVIYPDKPGLRDQVGHAALLMDLKYPSSLSDHIYSLLVDDKLKMNLIEKGYEQLKFFSKAIRLSKLESIIGDFHRRRMCWE